MKITVGQLRRIIRETVRSTLAEGALTADTARKHAVIGPIFKKMVSPGVTDEDRSDFAASWEGLLAAKKDVDRGEDVLTLSKELAYELGLESSFISWSLKRLKPEDDMIKGTDLIDLANEEIKAAADRAAKAPRTSFPQATGYGSGAIDDTRGT